MITNTHLKTHNLTEDEYRKMFNLKIINPNWGKYRRGENHPCYGKKYKGRPSLYKGKTFVEQFGEERAKEIIGRMKKNRVPWNKGKTKKTDARVAKHAELIVELHKQGKIPNDGFKGKHHTKETREQMSQTVSQQFENGERHPWTEGLTKETDERLLKHSKLISELRLKNPEWTRKIMIANAIKPNKPEMMLNNILDTIQPNVWSYVGDGSFLVGNKCPDFHSNKEDKVIELFGDYWHKKDEEDGRIKYFKDNGFDCLIIWEHELSDFSTLLHKLVPFIGGIIYSPAQ